MGTKDQTEHTKTFQQKKDWITPEVFDSPVIAVTKGTDSQVGSDGETYS